ncbi:tetratricopeptide repeat protein [Mariniflexile ostreae]|uniref:Tetratricopeptide repeat protein n=1 Tax=Mariniflexile ostreae TaxID=1520892 RepID=A0ABV5F823_9FLAO
MKNRVIITLAFSACVFSFAQKKELRTAEKAIKGNNYAEAKAALNQAKSAMSEMDGKQEAQYYYLFGQALYANGAGSNADFDKALESLNNVKAGYGQEVKDLKRDMINKLLERGNKAYESKDYVGSSDYFEKIYRLSPKDTTYLYYAASTAISVPDYNRALVLYEELKDLGYTGVEKQYLAVNSETKEQEVFQSKEMRDLSVKAKTHVNPTQKVSESKKAEIVKNIALIYKSNGDDEKAITALKEARKENPDDLNLLLVEADLQLKLGNREGFRALIEEATKKDPANPELQYNLGVIASESGDIDSAKKYYKKAVELDPKYVNAYINLAALILGEEEVYVKEMNGLGNSKKDNLRYDELKEARQQLYRDALPYLTKALEINPENIDAAKTLMNIYSILGETDNYKDMKAKVEALE